MAITRYVYDVGTAELGAAATETSGIMNGKSRNFRSVLTPTGNPLYHC